jgi:hypothetical protein
MGQAGIERFLVARPSAAELQAQRQHEDGDDPIDSPSSSSADVETSSGVRRGVLAAADLDRQPDHGAVSATLRWELLRYCSDRSRRRRILPHGQLRTSRRRHLTSILLACTRMHTTPPACARPRRTPNTCVHLAQREHGGAWRPRRATLQHAAAAGRRQTFYVSCAPDGGALSGAAPARKTCTHTLTANAGGELLVAATWEGLSIMSAGELRRAAEDHAL